MYRRHLGGIDVSSKNDRIVLRRIEPAFRCRLEAGGTELHADGDAASIFNELNGGGKPRCPQDVGVTRVIFLGAGF